MATRNRSTNAPHRKLIKLVTVVELTGLSPSTIQKYRALGQFPQSVKIGPHAVRWYLDEVLDYINTRPRSRQGLNGRVKTGHLWTPQNRPFPAARDWS